MKYVVLAGLLGALLLAAWGEGVRGAGNTVPVSHSSNTAYAVNANALKPPECAALNLTAIVMGSGEFEGGTANELLLGTSASQRIRGRDGNDCVIGGAGTDEIRGDAGTDVCIGSITSTFQDCETIVIRP